MIYVDTIFTVCFYMLAFDNVIIFFCNNQFFNRWF